MTSSTECHADADSLDAGGLRILRFGAMDYQLAWQLQHHVHRQVAEGTEPPTILLLQHHSVYTAGRRTEPHERPVDGTPVISVDRGGRITWHGPGQLVGYPVLRLPQPVDIVAYVGELEAVLIEVCAELGVVAERIEGRSGAWIRGRDEQPDRKIAAIGVGVQNGVTLHGFALNCNPDMRFFDNFVPCGITDAGVTSLSEQLSREVTVDEVMPIVEVALRVRLSAALT